MRTIEELEAELDAIRSGSIEPDPTKITKAEAELEATK